MRRLIAHFICAASLIRLAAAHEQPAHLRLTQDALQAAPRFDQALAEAGIEDLTYGLFTVGVVDYVLAASRVVDYRIANLDARSLIQAGAVLEDGIGASANSWCQAGFCDVPEFGEFSILRCNNHFQDPSGSGIWTGGEPAGSWAYDSAQNGFTWVGAVTYFTAGILHEQPDERRRRLEHAFVALGCNLHLIQDQFSPAHARNDAHPGHVVPGGEWAAGASLLESNGWRYLNPNRNDFRPAVVGVPSAGTHAKFFSKAVAWTNSRFFSDGTIFKYYLHPSAEETGSHLPDCTGGSLVSDYVDSRVVGTWMMKLAQRVEGVPGVLIPYLYHLEGVRCDSTEHVRGIDRVIYSNLQRLVPEAIGYSAALLDHFFRGRIEISQEGELLRVKSRTVAVAATADDPGMDGVFREGALIAVVEFPGGRRERIGRVSIPPHGLAPDETLTMQLDPIPSEAVVDGQAKIIVCLASSKVGVEPGVAAREYQWKATSGCDTICSYHDIFGIAPIGDVDGDGVGDLATSGMPYNDFGSISVLSGRTCDQIWRVPVQRLDVLVLGEVIGPGDLDGDGRGDVVARLSEELIALSGVDGSEIWRKPIPSTPYVELFTLGDGSSDFVVLLYPSLGESLDPWNRINIVRGSNGERLLSFFGLYMPNEFYSVSAGKDWDADGAADLLFVGPRVVSSSTGQILYDQTTIKPSPPFQTFVSSVLQLQSPTGTIFVGQQASHITAFEPWPTATLFEIPALSPYGSLTDFTCVGDIDGDGYEDFGYRADDVSLGIGNVLLIRSGATGALLHEFQSWSEATALGDIDGDGHADFAFVLPPGPGKGPSTCVRIVYGR